MITVKRCTCYKDFKEMYLKNITDEKIEELITERQWNLYRGMSVIMWKKFKLEKFYSKHGYIDIEYVQTNKGKTYRVKKREKGRPTVIKAKTKKIEARVSSDEFDALENYCKTNNLVLSEWIRNSLLKIINQ